MYWSGNLHRVRKRGRNNLTETGDKVKTVGGQFITHNADLGTSTQKESHEVTAQIPARTGQVRCAQNEYGREKFCLHAPRLSQNEGQPSGKYFAFVQIHRRFGNC